jgi:hypothetical protein
LLYYTKNIPIESVINNCDDIKLFCFTTKTGHTYSATYYMINDKLHLANKVNRVVATTDTSLGLYININLKKKNYINQILLMIIILNYYKHTIVNWNKLNCSRQHTVYHTVD